MRSTLFALLAGTLLVAGCSSSEEKTVAAATTTPVSQPAQPQMGGVQPGTRLQDLGQSVPDRVFFGFDSAELTAEAQDALTAQARIFAANPQVGITIEGHADERGTREYNFALGARRATAAKNFLVALGVPSQRIRTVSFGKERPVDPGAGERSWAANRRAVTVVTGSGS